MNPQKTKKIQSQMLNKSHNTSFVIIEICSYFQENLLCQFESKENNHEKATN